MFYKIPSLIYYEDDCVINHHYDIAKLGKKALIVTGGSSKTNGSLNDVKKALELENIEYEIFDECSQNPEVELIMRLQKEYKDSNIDFVIGLGGGSCIDCAKATGVMLLFQDKDEDFLYEKVYEYKSLPVVAIPTTCGTGSEVTGAAVLTVHKKKTKISMSHRIYPTLSLLDKKYLKSLPQEVLNNSSIDALGHLIESYINTTATRMTNVFALEGMKIWSKCKEALLNGPKSEEDYDNLMLASLYGGLSIAHCGTSLPHGASYVLTYNLKIPHGKAVGYFLYGYLLCSDDNQVKTILNNIGFASLEEFKEFVIKVCHIEKVDEVILKMSVEELLTNKRKQSYCPFVVDEEVARKVVYSIE